MSLTVLLLAFITTGTCLLYFLKYAILTYSFNVKSIRSFIQRLTMIEYSYALSYSDQGCQLLYVSILSKSQTLKHDDECDFLAIHIIWKLYISRNSGNAHFQNGLVLAFNSLLLALT